MRNEKKYLTFLGMVKLRNQLFYGLWGAGVLELTLTEDDLGISAEDLSILFPEMTGLTITTDPLEISSER